MDQSGDYLCVFNSNPKAITVEALNSAICSGSGVGQIFNPQFHKLAVYDL